MSYQASRLNHVPTVANRGGHLIEPVVRPLCNFDCPRLGTTTSRACIHGFVWCCFFLTPGSALDSEAAGLGAAAVEQSCFSLRLLTV